MLNFRLEDVTVGEAKVKALVITEQMNYAGYQDLSLFLTAMEKEDAYLDIFCPEPAVEILNDFNSTQFILFVYRLFTIKLSLGALQCQKPRAKTPR